MRCLNLAVAGASACLIVGCATQSKPTLTSGRRIPNVRTTAYTHLEGGSGHVDIDILQWGSEKQSLKVLAPRCKHSCVQKMVASLQQKKTQGKKELLASLDSKKPQPKKKT